jgi:hypothetical protein
MNDRRTVNPALARPKHRNDTCSVTTTSLLHSILDWLRAGYPEGVPGPDRVPLLALLRATPLTEDQIKQVVRNVTSGGSTAMADGEIGEDEIARSSKTSHITTPVRRTFNASPPSWPRPDGRFTGLTTLVRRTAKLELMSSPQ